MSSPPTTDPKPTAPPRSEPLIAYPDMGSLVAHMDRARADGDEALRALLNPRYELAHAHAAGWGAHIPMLSSVIATARPGPVLEIGVGRCSSPMLVEMCRAMGRRLVGVDSERDWLEEVAGVLDYPNLVHMRDWSKLSKWAKDIEPEWSVIFIDHGPGEARLPVLRDVHENLEAEFIVCHDTFNPGYLIGYDDYMSKFTYRSDYTLFPSCTTVLSDVRPYAGAR